MRHAARVDEVLQVVAFVLVMVGVFGAALRLLYRRWRGQATRFRPSHVVVLTTAAVGVLCILYGRFIEPRWLEVTDTRVVTARLPAGHRGVRIVHLSDIHSDATPKLEEELPARIEALHPDLIVFTGDAANSNAGVPVFRACLTALAKIAPTYAVHGNWEWRSNVTSDRFSGTRATVLDGTASFTRVAGSLVYILGAAYGGNTEGMNNMLGALPEDGPAIVLFHLPYPDVIRPELASRVDLMCAGHTHGGQVALPFYGALLTLSKFGKRFERGFYPTADGFGFPLYVSRGIGEGGAAPHVRFCSRPEIAVIDLVPQDSRVR